MIFARKTPEFYMKLPEIFPPKFFFWGGGARAPLPPVSYAYAVCCCTSVIDNEYVVGVWTRWVLTHQSR